MKKNMLASIIFVTMFFVGMFAGAAGGEASSQGHGLTGSATRGAGGCVECTETASQVGRSCKDVEAGVGTCPKLKKESAKSSTKPAQPAAASDQQK